MQEMLTVPHLRRTDKDAGGGGMSRCPICGSKECCGGYYQEVQDVLVEVLKGAKWLIDCYVAKPEGYKEYQDVVRAIQKWGGEE